MSLAVMLLAAPSGAYSYMHTDTSKRLHLTPFNPWVDGPYVPMAANTTNQSGITPEELQTAVVGAFRMWQAASFGAFSFDYWQGGGAEFEVGMKRDGISSLFFASADPAHGGLGPSQSAYTRVYFDAETGAIDEVDIVLNDVDMSFTTSADKANYRGGNGGHVIVLEDVIAHELGHVLGLGHSGVLDATMFAYGWDGQAALSCDDVRAVRSLYGTGDHGALTGRILDPRGEPVLGAHVVAIELAGPSIAASSISARDGSYRIAGLPKGNYVVMAEPFGAGAEALDDIYADMNLTGNCSGQRFSRSFYGSPDGRLDVMALAASSTANAGDLVVSCDGVTPAITLRSSEPPTLEFDQKGLLAAVLLATPDSPQQVLLQTLDGPLEVDFLAYSLFSPASVLPELDGHDGTTATADLASAALSTSARSRDSRLSVDWVAAGEHVMTLATSLLEPQTYPMGGTHVDDEPFVLVVARQTADDPPTECWEPAPVRDYSPPSGGPRRLYLDDDGPFGVSCQAAPGHSSSNGPSWLALATLLALTIAGRRARVINRLVRAERPSLGRSAD